MRHALAALVLAIVLAPTAGAAQSLDQRVLVAWEAQSQALEIAAPLASHAPEPVGAVFAETRDWGLVGPLRAAASMDVADASAAWDCGTLLCADGAGVTPSLALLDGAVAAEPGHVGASVPVLDPAADAPPAPHAARASASVPFHVASSVRARDDAAEADGFTVLPGAPPAGAEPTRWTSASPPVSAQSTTGPRSALADAAVVVGAAVAGAGAIALVAAALYTRITRKGVLANATRARVHEAVLARPGASAADVARTTGIHLTTAQYHLRVLVKSSMLVARELDGHLRHFAPGVPDSAWTPERPARSEAAERLLEAARAAPGRSVKELAAAVGVSPQLASYHVRALAASGLADVHAEGRSVRVFPRSA